MSSKSKIWWFVGAVLFIGGIAYLAYYFANKKADPTIEVYDEWEITYDPKDKNPYGTYVIKELLDSIELGKNFEEYDDPARIKLDSNEIFLFIGREMYLSNASRDSLVKNVSEGATAFLILEKLDQDLVDLLLYNNISDFQNDSIAQFSFTHPELKGVNRRIIYMDEKKYEPYPWKYIDRDNIYFDSVKILGTNENDKINFIRFNVGDGYIFIHTSPIAFTNLNILRKEGFLYAEDVFSHLPPGKIQYHSYARFKGNSGNNDGGDGGGGDEAKKSPLEYILSQPALKWAFFVLVSMLLITLLFKSRRRRRPIKIIEKKSNTTVGHIDTVATIFMQQKQHQKLIAIKEMNFYKFIQNHYYITPTSEGDKFDKRLSDKSGIDMARIANLRNALYKSKGYANQAILHQVHKEVDYFYQNCSVSRKGSLDSKRMTRAYVIKKPIMWPLIFLGIGLLLSFAGLIGLVFSIGLGVVPIILGVGALSYGFINLNKELGTIKEDTFTTPGKNPISIELKKLIKISIESDVLYMEDANGFVSVNLKALSPKDKTFFEGLASKYHKTN